MITDSQTNFIYLADTLKLKYPKFSNDFQKILKQAGVDFSFLPNTKDVWAVDYMPIQINENEFVQFQYHPDYLIDTIKWKKTISDTDLICEKIGLKTKKSEIILDGGNVIKSDNKVIMCDKIFLENSEIEFKELVKQLETLFQVDKITFIPTHPLDKIGHADGILRFYDEQTVLLNQFSNDDKKFEIACKASLKNAGIDFIEIPYNPYQNTKNIDATGIYINYLEVGNTIILPVFGISEDDEAVKKFEVLFPNHNILTLKSCDLAKDGGVLNCITWNVYNNLASLGKRHNT
ncbi:hypothetical protein EZJ43_03095 [Pedobacter changchengzhani]|uniref:Agmatine deiminase family protein n=1 Tax=Pedobacter changchengzhani TaxID=2529274 RepID=A0A4R5MMX7_9SPHI|nr:agmatine deiminase family protein [Pedobacter changchengzhani]TDG37120.1 hypothetical protein EZJ43_03095 [Pedobacter changchengzhani]